MRQSYMTPIRHIALFVATAFAVSSVRAGDDDTHLASSYMRAAISAGLPKYEPKRALVTQPRLPSWRHPSARAPVPR